MGGVNDPRNIAHTSRLDRHQERLNADDIHYAREVVREHVQRHLGRHLWQRLHQKVRRSHPHLQRAEWVLDRLAACSHRIRIFVEPRLHGFDNAFVLPPRDAALRSLCALSLQRAGLARVGNSRPYRDPGPEAVIGPDSENSGLPQGLAGQFVAT